MKYILVIFLFYSTNISAETCKWWFQRYGWKNFDLSQVEVCLKNGSPVVADIEGGESPLHIAAEVNDDPDNNAYFVQLTFNTASSVLPEEVGFYLERLR